MFLSVLAFLAGDLYLQTVAHLPPLILSAAVGIGVLCFIFCKQFSSLFGKQGQSIKLHYVLLFLFGWAYSAWYAQQHLSWSLTSKMETKPIQVRGIITSLPLLDANGTRFEFVMQQGGHLRLTWRQAPQPLRAGDEWLLTARLKRIHGMQSPGAFDFEAWAIQKNLRATGYVMTNGSQLLSHKWYRYPLNQLRQHLQEKIIQYLPASPTAPWLLALMLGEKEGIPSEQWQILRNTGTNHLMAIAGLHIGMMALFIYTIINWLWRRSYRLVLMLPANHAAAIGALSAAFLYSALAGFSIPTQRAFIMLTIITVAWLMRRQMPAWHVWGLTMFGVLLLNPLNTLVESFWLSFGTIALIIYGMDGRVKPRGWWWKWGRVQWVIGLGLVPVSLVFFQSFSLVSFVANTIAIPWLSFAILPFCLLSSIFLFILPALGAGFLWIADKSLAGLWLLLTWFSHYSHAVWYQAVPNYFILLLAVLGCLLLLLPRGIPGRWLGVIWCAPLFLYVPGKPMRGDFWVSMLDVGQGLAVIVRTANHTLVYDAGAKYNDTDMGERIVVPYLRVAGIRQIDELVISHGDNDHLGGVPTLLNAMQIKSIHTSVPEKLLVNANYCLGGQSWQWDGVNFSFLYPSENELGLGNDSSCVLRVDSRERSVLLTGDIEKYAEKIMLAQHANLSVDLLIAPHHGSKTSAQIGFIKSVAPDFVLYSTGYRNRYHFPHAKVSAAYAGIQAQQWNSVDTGTLQVKFNHGKEPQFEAYRIKHARYWMDAKSDSF